MVRVIADEKTAEAVVALVHRTYDAMSTPGSDIATIFDSPWMNVTGSGQGELFTGDVVRVAATTIASWGLRWKADEVTVWRHGDSAWAQILGSVHVVREDTDEVVPYWTTGVFTRDDLGEWRWQYWGGSEPQAEAKV